MPSPEYKAEDHVRLRRQIEFDSVERQYDSDKKQQENSIEVAGDASRAEVVTTKENKLVFRLGDFLELFGFLMYFIVIGVLLLPLKAFIPWFPQTTFIAISMGAMACYMNSKIDKKPRLQTKSELSKPGLKQG